MVDRAILFITTHGMVKLNSDREMHIIKTPLKVSKLDSVKLGICNFYQPGTPNIIPNIMEKFKKEKPKDTAEFIKEELINFETRKEIRNTRGGPYLEGMRKDWSDLRDPEHDPNVVEFDRYFANRYQIKHYEKKSDIINKTYTVYKSEKLPEFENRVMLYLDGVLYDILTTWKVDGIYRTDALEEQLLTGDQISITLEEILEVISEMNKKYRFNKLVIADLTCSVFIDEKGAELSIEKDRKLRYLSRTSGNQTLPEEEKMESRDEGPPGEEPPNEKAVSEEVMRASRGEKKRSKKKKKSRKKKKKGGTKKRSRRLKK